MKKIIPIVIVVALIVAAIIVVPKFMHTCDDCDKFFVGYAYEPSLLSDIAELVTDENMEKICKDCAEKQHFLTDPEKLDEYRIDPFG